MRIFLLIVVLLSSQLGMAQLQMDEIIPGSSDEYSGSVRDRLVRLAWENYPINDVYESEIYIAERNLKISGWRWTENLSMFYNLNDRTLAEQNQGNIVSGIPVYGLGVSLNIGDFIKLPNNVKTAREQYNIEVSQRDAQKLNIRAQVLRLYNEYLLAREILKIRLIDLNETETNPHVVEENFRNGEASILDYNQAMQMYNSSKESKITQEFKVKEVKINLEELIGVDLEEVLEYR